MSQGYTSNATLRPNPSKLNAFLEPVAQAPLKSVTLRKTTIPSGTFRHKILAKDKYVQLCGRFRSYEDFPTANPLENVCGVPDTQKPEREPPLLTNSKARTTVDDILAFSQTHAPARTLELSFNADAANKFKVAAPRMMGPKLIQEDLQPVEVLPSSDAFCKLPSQRRREHIQEIEQMRADQFLREARKKHNVVHRRLNTLHRAGFLGSGENETPEQIHQRQLMEKHNALMQKRREILVQNDHKFDTTRSTPGDNALSASVGKALPQSPPTLLIQRKRHCIGPSNKFSVQEMMADNLNNTQPNRMAKLVYQDNRARGFDIISGVVDDRVAKCPYEN